jgi:mono/diheme cytochrome c family protein
LKVREHCKEKLLPEIPKRNIRSYFLTPEWGRSTEIASWFGAIPGKSLRNEAYSILKIRMFVITVLGLAAFHSGSGSRLQAQAKPAVNPPAAVKLSVEERRGEGLFLQRCSLCHLPRKLKFGSPPVIGPALSGQFKDANPDQMKILRGFILKGGPDMPGFQYGLESGEIDELIAYLKTL